MPNWTQIITFAIAVLSALLGLVNLWRSIDRDRVKLRVRFVFVKAMNVPGLSRRAVGIEVVNLSGSPVTVEEVGLELCGTTCRLAFFRPITSDGKSLPRRLEPRESVTAYLDRAGLNPDAAYRGPYARTSCGKSIRRRQKIELTKSSTKESPRRTWLGRAA